MSTFRKQLMVAIFAMLALFFGPVWEARAGVIESKQPVNCGNLPVIKNLTGLKAAHVCDGMAAPKELSRGEVKKLAANAKSPEDHLTIARFYRAEASGLDAQAVGYERGAALLRNGQDAKNLVSPTTVGRFEFLATRFREEAKADRAMAVSHDEMANTVVASLDSASAE
jgi:hypothetical protein